MALENHTFGLVKKWLLKSTIFVTITVTLATISATLYTSQIFESQHYGHFMPLKKASNLFPKNKYQHKDPYVLKLHGDPQRNITTHDQLLPVANIIGVNKCGTAAFLFFMKMHPQIVVGTGESHSFTDHFNEGLDYLDRKYADVPANKLILEKSGDYWKSTYRTPEVVQRRIKHTYAAYGKDVKLMVIVCDPTKRIMSSYSHHVDKYNTKLDLEDFKTFIHYHSDEKRLDSVEDRGHQIMDVYADIFPKWLQYFSREQIHIVNGESLKTDPYQELKNVERFLQLDDFLKPDMFKFNETKGFYCKFLNNVSFCMGESKGREHVVVPEKIQRSLREMYEPHNNRFFKQIGQYFDW